MRALKHSSILEPETSAALNFAKYEKIVDSLECCTKKLEKLVEKTTEIEKQQYKRKK